MAAPVRLLVTVLVPLLVGFLAGACSTVPARTWPPHELRTVRALYHTDGAPFAVPMSGPELTILEFSVEPPPAREFFRGGRRWLVPGPGCRELVVRCRYRAYARTAPSPGGHDPTSGTALVGPPSPQRLFEGAIEVVDDAL